MSVRFIPGGEFVNASERIAIERLRAKLQSVEAFWILFSNLNHSAQPGSRSDEIDLIAIGPSGIYVIGSRGGRVWFAGMARVAHGRRAGSPDPGAGRTGRAPAGAEGEGGVAVRVESAGFVSGC